MRTFDKRIAGRRHTGNKQLKKNNIAAMVLLILAAAITLYFMTAGKPTDSAARAQYPEPNKTLEIILKKLVVSNQGAPGNMAVVIGDQVDSSRLKELANTPYEKIKSEMGVKNDFAIYFVSGDDTIIPIGSKPCIGSPEAEVDGRRCG
ncbi:hypothetical protein HYV82_00015 [Candidatus Woesearchaeota archaeon]|nr:hypothetical protein [Candidatus Woesearchaeota archaeon]